MKGVNFSVVIPTCNRKESLLRLMSSINNQTILPDEIIVVDSSDNTIQPEDLDSKIPLIVLKTVPSVCIQRNRGISEAKYKYVLLCDDDIELSHNYTKELLDFLEKHPEEGAVTGFWTQLESDGRWHKTYPVKSFGQLLFSYLFGHSLWGSVNNLNPKPIFKGIYHKLCGFYQAKGNAITKAGWPINTQYSTPIFQVRVTSLGASMVKKTWLMNSKYEEVFDSYGIGDNYGVCLGFPEGKRINVLYHLEVKHHKSPENRLKHLQSFYRRTLALHFYLHSLSDFNFSNRLWFKWSLLGYLIVAVKSFEWKRSYICLKLLSLGFFQQNPYITGKKRGLKIVAPRL